MFTLADILLLVALPLLLAASAFFSGSETALFSLTAEDRRTFEGSHSLVVTLLAETRSLLITLLMGNMVVNVLYFVITTVLLLHLRDAKTVGPIVISVASVLPLIFVILLGEVLPKLLASRIRVGWSRWCAAPLLFVHRVIGPVRFFVQIAVIGPLARLVAPPLRPPELSAEELESLLQLSQSQGVIDAQEEQMLQQVLELGQLQVMDLMTPRVDVHGFDLGQDANQLIDIFRQTRLTQVPVYTDDLDHIEGIVRARDALLSPPTSRDDVRKLLRPARFVPELMRLDRLLVDLRDRKTTVAIAVDEYGGTAGLITLEDVVEHMVGHIHGPYDDATDEPAVVAMGSGRWRIGADLPVDDLVDALRRMQASVGLPALASRWGVSTLGGLVMSRLGRLPRVGDTVRFGNVKMEVEKMDRRRVRSVVLAIEQVAKPRSENAEVAS